jgi:hypothetical protein
MDGAVTKASGAKACYRKRSIDHAGRSCVFADEAVAIASNAFPPCPDGLFRT